MLRRVVSLALLLTGLLCNLSAQPVGFVVANGAPCSHGSSLLCCVPVLMVTPLVHVWPLLELSVPAVLVCACCCTFVWLVRYALLF